MGKLEAMPRECDVLVVGSGAGGLSTALTAKINGLDVVVVEKEKWFGGTTAFSGGVLWIPGNRHAAQGVDDSRDEARRYLRHEIGNAYDEDVVELFLDRGPEMLDFFEANTEVRFIPTLYPDYHPDRPGGVDVGRSVLAAPYDASVLGSDLPRLRPPLSTITFMGMMFNSSNADIRHFFNATKSVKSAAYVARRLANHAFDVLRYRQGVKVTSGNALAARLAKSALDRGIPILTETAATRLLVESGQVVGAVLVSEGVETDVRTRNGVVLAAGGFPHDEEKRKAAYPHLQSGGEHLTPTPSGNTGDGIRMAQAIGAHFDLRFRAAAAWMPVSKVPKRDGGYAAFPHLLDRYKPGVIAVLRNGRRFTNESNSYHDVGAAMIEACAGEAETAAWLICDQSTIRKYGLGFAKPAPLPLGPHIRSGYLVRGATLEELAAKAGIDGDGLRETVTHYNETAGQGTDPAWGRGTTAFNRFLGDPDHKPNPNVAPVAKGPFYALKLVMGDLGTFDGLSTDAVGAVLDENGTAIPGLFAVGNDRASMMGGTYPGAGITLGPIMCFGYVLGLALAGR